MRAKYAPYFTAKRDLENQQRIADTIFMRVLAEKVLSQVGRHALNSAADFVGEVYAGMQAGKRYDDDIMERYHRMIPLVEPLDDASSSTEA